MAAANVPTKRLAEKWRRSLAVDDVTLCKICDREFDKPRTLPCLHSFCEDCLLVLLQSYERQKKLDRTFKCPTCKIRIPCHVISEVSRQWLSMFPEKETIDNMKEATIVVEEICRLSYMSLVLVLIMFAIILV